MRNSVLVRYALVVCAAGVILSDCGGAQSPIEAPGAIPQSMATHVIPPRVGSTSLRRPPSPTVYKVLHSFGRGTDGTNPFAGLVDVNGELYGTTTSGGSSNYGTVYKLSLTGRGRVLYGFKGAPDGAAPYAGLIDVNGTLYGTTTYDGGSSGSGTVFSITATGSEKVLHSFGGGSADGTEPFAGLVAVHGTLYGTTYYGGSEGCGGFGCGVVYTISTSGLEKVLHRFGYGPDGTYPWADLIDVNGTLYGTTYGGGSFGNGTVYKMSASGRGRVLYSFKPYPDGNDPAAALINVNGTLYGTTEYGGIFNGGTVYTISTTGVETVLHSFAGPYGTDGRYPAAGLVDMNGTLYGTTTCGGVFGTVHCSGGFSGTGGTVFSISTSGKERVLHSFAGGGDGDNPGAGLIDVNGTLYGTTIGGGAHGDGTVFALTP